MNYFRIVMLLSLWLWVGCEDEVRDITGGNNSTPPPTPTDTTITSEVIPVDINTKGFDFLDKMQGHWVGKNRVMTTDYPWFGWDFRAISPSHVQGIHEGGTQGNLFLSFFVTHYKNKRTIMARNGGLLNGIYRTSYFVMDEVEDKGNEGKLYRFVDAIGGTAVMSFEARFKQDSLYMNVYTSNLGNRVPSRHMTLQAKKMHLALAEEAASATNFPQNSIDTGLDFANGFNEDYLYIEQAGQSPKSATFLAQGSNNNVYTLAGQSGDPYIISDHPRLGTLTANFTRNSQITSDNLLVYLSRDPLTDSNGYLTSNASAYSTILHFPALVDNEDSFLFTYLHPGSYHITVVADKDKDFSPSQGDIVSISQAIQVAPLENKVVNITNIDVQN